MHYSFHRRSMLALAALPLTGTAASAGDTAGLTSETMTGKTLRVFTTGDAITMDYSEDRINIELDASHKIVRVFVG